MKSSKRMIIFYGTNWCPDCLRSKKLLDELKINYHFINLEKNQKAVKEVEKINNGLRSIPTIIFPNGQILVEPTNEALKKTLKENGFI